MIRYRPRGMILVLVLVVIALLALAAGTFSYLMVAERKAADVSGRQAQARALADSGVEMVRRFIAQEKEVQDQLGGWYDNPLQFSGRSVIGDPQALDAGQFSVVAHRSDYGVAEGIRYGLEDESTRLNVNVLGAIDKKLPGTGREILMGLPGMTEDIADAILDWLDEDEETREFGAEAEYYSVLEPPYTPKNGPLESIEELLLVRGIRENPLLLFGCDADRNGLLDAGEPDGQSIANVDNSDGSMNRGWAAYLTLYGYELNENPDGKKKINLNQNDMEKLYEQLEEVLGSEQATFIVAYRQGEDAGDNEPAASGIGSEDLDLSQKPQRTLSTVLDLIGKNAKVTLQGNNGDTDSDGGGSSDSGNSGNSSGSSRGGSTSGGGNQDNKQLVLETPFPDEQGMMDAYLPTLMDHVAVVASTRIAGRININQASRTVLLGIPGMTEEIADNIIGQREPNPTVAMPGRRHETWILSEGLVTLEQMKSLMPFVTAGGTVYRAQVIGYFSRGGPVVRIETVIDASHDPARIVFWRDISNLGRGYSPEMLYPDAGTGF